jgi:hypothetical protein
MRVMLDVKCAEGHITEKFGKLDAEYRCGVCGLPAKHVVTGLNFKLEGTSGAFPTAADKWAKEHVRAAKQGADND